MSHPLSRVAACAVLVFVGLFLPASVGSTAAAPGDGFQLATVWSGFNTPTAIAFTPNGRVFVTERAGIIKTFDSVADSTATIAADRRTNSCTRSETGACSASRSTPPSPDVRTSTSPTLDAPPGGTAPYYNDLCPLNNGHKDGCPATGRASWITVDGAGRMVGPETVLIGGSFLVPPAAGPRARPP